MKKKKEFKVEIFGSASIENLPEEQQRNFYITLFARILEMYKKKLENENKEV